jgi:chaperonin cofactor prefoldin
MLGLFKKKSAVEKLYDRYEKLMAESHSLSKSDRAASDRKFSEAQDVLKEIEALEAKK